LLLYSSNLNLGVPNNLAIREVMDATLKSKKDLQIWRKRSKMIACRPVEAGAG
jgi:hypothetical protein